MRNYYYTYNNRGSRKPTATKTLFPDRNGKNHFPATLRSCQHTVTELNIIYPLRHNIGYFPFDTRMLFSSQKRIPSGISTCPQLSAHSLSDITAAPFEFLTDMSSEVSVESKRIFNRRTPLAPSRYFAEISQSQRLCGVNSILYSVPFSILKAPSGNSAMPNYPQKSI